MSRKIEIVIVGGGSGASLASKLSAARAKFDPAKYNITLITPLPYHVFLIATARIAATPEGALDSTDQAFIPLDKVFNSEKGNAGRVVRGRVTDVLEDRVELDDGTSLRYDYLILATGSVWSGPTNYGQHSSEGQVRSHINTWRKNISSARRIVIVGGGAVGIGAFPVSLYDLALKYRFLITEIAGEIKHYHPRTAVTIVHGGDKLLNGAYPDKLRDRIKKRLETAGVNVILGDRVLDVPDEGLSGQDSKPAVLRTTHGVTLDADLFVRPSFCQAMTCEVLKVYCFIICIDPRFWSSPQHVINRISPWRCRALVIWTCPRSPYVECPVWTFRTYRK